MKERPILFSAAMVRALLAGEKTQTRRTVRAQLVVAVDGAGALPAIDVRANRMDGSRMPRCPYGAAGDLLWVKESWAVGATVDALPPSLLDRATWLEENGGLWFPADGAARVHAIAPRGRTRSGIHMPRWASRITLEITGVRLERLQAISELDALAEGIMATHGGFSLPDGSHFHADDPRAAYLALWDSINAAGAAQANPWVWAVSFWRVQPAKPLLRNLNMLQQAR